MNPPIWELLDLLDQPSPLTVYIELVGSLNRSGRS